MSYLKTFEHMMECVSEENCLFVEFADLEVMSILGRFQMQSISDQTS